jgi:radical SAM/Cys-rich protein
MIPNFKETIRKTNPAILSFDKLQTMQVNLGNICNQRCEHCHIEAGPAGGKIMTKEIIEKIILFLRNYKGLILDITGGCPELNPHFKYLIETAHGLVSRLIARTNLTILAEKDMDWIPEWYKEYQVVVMASLPCYTEDNVDKQRGNGVFEKSIRVLKRLNELGYGSSPELNLVYNPNGDFLPASQKKLEEDYKNQLFKHHRIRFNKLFTITNAPIGRFKKYLESNGRSEKYLKLLVDNCNPDTLENLMCRTLINIDWQGILYNCDFNQASGLPMRNGRGEIIEIDSIKDAIEKGHEILTGNHCYCCTAGAGSSCTGELIR